MLSIISLSVTVLLLSGLSEQALYPGSCSNYAIPPVQPFFPTKAFGVKVWYLVSADDAGLPYENFDCIRFSHAVAIGTGQVRTREYAKNLATNESSSSISFMDFGSFNGNYTYRTAGVPDQPTTIVLSSSLKYYVEVSCADVGGEANIYVGIFSSSPGLSSTALDRIYRYLEQYKIKSTNLKLVQQRAAVCG